MVFPGRMGSGVAEFYALHRRDFPAWSIKRALAAQVGRLIVVDTRLASRLGPFRPLLHQPGVEVHIYDHHPPTAESVVGDQEWVEEVGAAVTLVLERCLEQGLEITAPEATLALIALHEETGSFRYASTTPRDLQAAAHLLERGANLEVVNEFLKEPLDSDQRALMEEYLSKGELLEGPGGRVLIAGAKRAKSVFGLGLLATRLLEIHDADACFCLQEVDGKQCSIAARSSNDDFAVDVWVSRWGGGGHSRAAAASGVKASLEEIVAELRDSIEQAVQGAPVTVGDAMSRDVFWISKDTTIEQAKAELIRVGFRAALVEGEDRDLSGIVSRSDLERALEHDLGHAPASSVMTHRVVSVQASDPLEEVRRLVVQRGAGTLPVFDEGRVVGVISRTDLLRDLYHQEETTRAWARGVEGRRVSLDSLSEVWKERIRRASEMARQRRERLYLVGGSVRDLLLGRACEDLDLVLEGDALTLAKELAAELGATLHQHEKYLTASLRFSDGDKLDIATARREVYCRPAALPEVSQSDLKADLYRRDFTINSLAVMLSGGLEGPVVDFFGGLADLESGVIRCLHNHSFLDDPTRMIRAVRFEQRLDMTIEPATRHLLSSALQTGVFDLAKPERLREELRLALSETKPLKVLERLQSLKLLPAIFSGLNLRGKVALRVQCALEFLESFPELVPQEERWKVPLFVLGMELTDESREAVRSRFGWPKFEWPFDIIAAVGRISGASDEEMPASKVAELLDRLSPVALVVFSSLSRHARFQRRLERYLEQHRNSRPIITGRELLECGLEEGPQLAELKARALAAQRDGVFSDVEGGKAWVRGALASAVSSA